MSSEPAALHCSKLGKTHRLKSGPIRPFSDSMALCYVLVSQFQHWMLDGAYPFRNEFGFEEDVQPFLPANPAIAAVLDAAERRFGA